MSNNLFDPIINGVQHITYHRKPTRAEVAFGYGAIHFRDFPKDAVTKPDGRLKIWILADDGLRYYL